MLASLAILSIATTVGLYVVKTGGWRGDAAAREFVGRLESARASAILERTDYAVAFDVDGQRYTIFADRDGDGSLDPAEPGRTYALGATAGGMVFGYVPGAHSLDGSSLDEAVTFAGASPRVTFTHLGTAADGVVYLVAEADRNAGMVRSMRAISVNAATARIRLWRYDENAAAAPFWRLKR